MDQLLGNKKITRKRLLTIRNSIAPEQRKEKSDVIADTLLRHLLIPPVESVFSYVHYQSEVETLDLIKKILGKKIKVSVPLISSSYDTMSAIEIRNPEKELAPGYKGIPEPDFPVEPARVVEPRNIDMVIVPGVVFDTRGGRIGYGGGFYDRFLCNEDLKAVKVGLAFSRQIVDLIQTEPHDVMMDYIITETDLIRI